MEYQLLCYTRKPDETMYYGPRLAYSMHIALREGDGKYIPLNHNSGVLFARATENADGSLNPKSLKKPYIVRLADGSFEIHALRIEGDGQAEVNETELCFKSSDLVVYEEMSECDCTCTAQKPDEAGEAFDEALISGIVGCVPGNVISITEKEAQYLKNKLMTPEIVRLEVQDSVQVSGAEDIGKIQATAYYSDGTSLNRSVDWNVGEIDFTKKGVAQKITGTVKQKRFAFPLLINRADPCITSWNGKYYFIFDCVYNTQDEYYLNVTNIQQHNIYEHAAAASDIPNTDSHQEHYDKAHNDKKKITAYAEEELRYGRYLLDNKSEVLYEYLNKELTSCNNIRNSLINNKEQSISIKSRIHAIDEDIAVINKALGRWKE